MTASLAGPEREPDVAILSAMAKKPHRSGNPANRAAGTSRPSGQPTGAFHVASRKLLVRLTRLPAFVVPGAMVALLLIGLMAPLPFAVPAFVIVLAFIGWLAVLSWPVLTSRGRLMRGIVFGVVLGALIARIAGVL